MRESNVGDMNIAKEFVNIPNTFSAMAIAQLRGSLEIQSVPSIII